MKKALNAYIKAKHTQEECIGFIDGYKQACEDIQKKLDRMLDEAEGDPEMEDTLLNVQESINQLIG